MAEGNGNFDRVIKLVTILGVPAVIACFLVYWLTTDMSGRLTNITNDLNYHKLDAQHLIKSNEEMKYQLYFTTQLLQQICSNTAKNTSQADNCFNRTSSRNQSQNQRD